MWSNTYLAIKTCKIYLFTLYWVANHIGITPLYAPFTPKMVTPPLFELLPRLKLSAPRADHFDTYPSFLGETGANILIFGILSVDYCCLIEV